MLTTRIFKKYIRFISYLKYCRSVRIHKSKIPQIFLQDKYIVEELEKEGVCITHIDKLELTGSRDLIDAAQNIIPNIDRDGKVSTEKAYVAHGAHDILLEDPTLIRWGLSERLLSIVENYIRVPIFYRGFTFRKDRADGLKVETRLWHMDGEDRRIVKIIIYLNDVGINDGPFEYIPKGLTPNRHRIKFQSGGRVLDENMSELVQPEFWKSCIGKAGTIVIADTCSVYHRGRVPLDNDRYTLFYCYNSKNPIEPEYCAPLFEKKIFIEKLGKLNPRQKSCVDV